MSKTLTITLTDEGQVFRGDKLIATVAGDEISFAHHAYKKHRDEIDFLISGNAPDPDEDVDEAPRRTLASNAPPTTPSELFREGEKAGWYGEENPPVVEWRRDNWSKEAFAKRYGHKTQVLTEIYEQEGLEYHA